jgi:hypothetical protein
MRSLDQFCFSEQYIFVMCLGTAGMMSWMLGLQIIFVNDWNVFDDPATAVITFGSLAWCRATHIVTLIAADYLGIWRVRDTADVKALHLEDLFLDKILKDDDAAPAAPKGSLHETWIEPSPRNFTGLERYCQAFLQENQLWLQLAFAELTDRKVVTQHREALLRSLAQLLEEVQPEHYAPDQGQGERTGLEFAAEPVQHLTIAAGEVQRADYKGSTTQALLKMWRQRAQFMLHLARVSSSVKIDSIQRKDRCEICGQTAGLVVTPIYTLMHLASSYRQQRDMSPLWNMVFWKHFYKTFTPTCTTCEECRDYYHSRNQNVPVDEKRFRRLQEREKTPFEIVQESQFEPVPIDQQAQDILHLWLAWVRKLAAGEEPRNFLPEYGIEGRTLAEIRQDNLKEANDDEEEDDGIPVEEEVKAESEASSEVDPDDPESIARHRFNKLKKLRDQQISDDEGEEHQGETPYEGVDPDITWSTRTLAIAWLNKARQNMLAPQLQSWAQPLPPAMFKAQQGLPRVPHAAPPPPPRAPAGPMGVGASQAVGLGLPSMPAAPLGGAAAATGPMGLPPAPNLAPPPGGGVMASLPPFPGGDSGGGDRGGGMTGFMDGNR